MKFVLTTIKDFEKKLDITVPCKEIQLIKKEEIISIRKKTNINGFRKNKIPIEIIQKKYKEQIKQNTIQKTIYNNLNNIIKIKKLHIINEPKITIHQYKKNSDFIFSIYFQCLPNINLNHFKKYNIQKTSIIINNTDIKYYINDMHKNQVFLKKNKKQIKKNDQITINYQIKTDISYISPIQELTFTINKKNIIPQITKQILKKQISDTILVTMNVDKQHPDKNYKGKKITIQIDIKEVLSVKKKYSHEEFIEYLKKKLYVQTYEEVKNIITNQLKKDIINLEYKYLKNQIIQYIKKSDIIQIPKTLIEETMKNEHQKIQKKYLKKNGHILQKKYYTNIQEKISNKIKLDLILKSIIYHNNINITQNEIKQYIQTEQKKNHILMKILPLQKNRTKLIHYIHNILLEKKIIQYLLKFFNVTYKTTSLKKILQKIHI